MNNVSAIRRSDRPATGLKGLLLRLYGHRRRGATAAAALLTVGVAYHVVFGANGLTVYQQKRNDAQALSLQVDALKAENDRLQDHVERLKSDPGSIEHQAREQLHYARPGEVIVALPNERPADSPDGNPK